MAFEELPTSDIEYKAAGIMVVSKPCVLQAMCEYNIGNCTLSVANEVMPSSSVG